MLKQSCFYWFLLFLVADFGRFALSPNFGDVSRRDGLTGILTSFLEWLDCPVLLPATGLGLGVFSGLLTTDWVALRCAFP